MSAATAITFLEIVLDNPASEEAFGVWWAEAEKLLGERARLERALLAVHGRGRYTAVLEFPLPGSFKLAAESRPWQELEARRPPSRVEVREARIMRQGVNVTTTELRRWLAERDSGEGDFVLLDALKPDAFAEKHLPGAVNLPAEQVTAESAAQIIGDHDRPVVVYCAHYG